MSCLLKISGLSPKEAGRQTLAKTFHEIWEHPDQREQFIKTLENYRVYDDSRRGRYAELFPMVLETGKKVGEISSVAELGCSNFSALLDLVKLFGEKNIKRIIAADIAFLRKHPTPPEVERWLNSGKMKYYQWNITKPPPEDLTERDRVDLVTALNVVVPHIEDKIPVLENVIYLSKKIFVISGGFYIEDYHHSGNYIFLHGPKGGIEVVTKKSD